MFKYIKYIFLFMLLAGTLFASNPTFPPTIGDGAPAHTPSALGMIYVDTTNDTFYISVDTVSSADWVQSTGGGNSATTDSNTIAFWDFNNLSASGNETGTTGSGQAGDLTLTQAGAVAGALSISPMVISHDDGKYRNLTGTGDQFNAAQKFIDGGLTVPDWTMEFDIRLDSIGVIHQIYDDSNNQGGAGWGIRVRATNIVEIWYRDDIGGFAGIQTIGTLSASTWYHVVARRTGTTYEIGFSSSPITSFVGIPANDRATSTTTAAWGASNSLPRLGDTNNLLAPLQGDIGFCRISNVVRY